MNQCHLLTDTSGDEEPEAATGGEDFMGLEVWLAVDEERDFRPVVECAVRCASRLSLALTSARMRPR